MKLFVSQNFTSQNSIMFVWHKLKYHYTHSMEFLKHLPHCIVFHFLQFDEFLKLIKILNGMKNKRKSGKFQFRELLFMAICIFCNFILYKFMFCSWYFHLFRIYSMTERKENFFLFAKWKIFSNAKCTFNTCLTFLILAKFYHIHFPLFCYFFQLVLTAGLYSVKQNYTLAPRC